MRSIVQDLRSFDQSNLDYEELGKFVKELNVDELEYKDLVPSLENSRNYAKNHLLLDPLECVVIHWPPASESAVHLHDGFCGYVLVLEGEGMNVEYEHQDDQLWCTREIIGKRGDVFDEPDGVIHKIANPSKTQRMVTVHFYYPAQDALEDMVIYDIENKRIGVLGENAYIASFDQPRENFKEFKENAFQVLPR